LKELWIAARILVVMAGRSRYQIVLSDEERRELEHRAACYSRPHREVLRAKLVLYAAEGLSNVEIGERLQMLPELVGRWRRRFYEERIEGLSDRQRAGRPRRFPPARGRPGQGDRVRAAQGSGRPAVAVLAL
jgi:Helix-turn-helix domain